MNVGSMTPISSTLPGRSDALLSAAIPHRGLSNTGALSPRYAHWRVTEPQSGVSRRLTVTAPKTASWKSFLDGGRFYDEPCLPAR